MVREVLGNDFCNASLRPVFLYKPNSKKENEALEKQKTKLEDHLKQGRYGLVSDWKVSPKWREIGKQKTNNIPGIWCFDDNSFHAKGRYVEFDLAEDESKKEEWLSIWSNEIQATESRDDENNVILHPNNDIPFKEDEDIQESEEIESNDNAIAMILLGYTKNERGETLFVLLNSWKKMPLIWVSFEYILACGCQINFLEEDLLVDILQGRRTCGLLGAECSHPDYVEDVSYAEYNIEGESDYLPEERSSR